MGSKLIKAVFELCFRSMEIGREESDQELRDIGWNAELLII